MRLIRMLTPRAGKRRRSPCSCSACFSNSPTSIRSRCLGNRTVRQLTCETSSFANDSFEVEKERENETNNRLRIPLHADLSIPNASQKKASPPRRRAIYSNKRLMEARPYLTSTIKLIWLASVSDLWLKVVEEGPRIDSKAVHALLDNTDVDPSYTRADLSMTALWSASYVNDVDLVRRLLSYPNIDVNSRYDGGIHHGTVYDVSFKGTQKNTVWSSTPLIVAAIRGHKDVVSLLLADPRCDVSLLAERTDYKDVTKSVEETVLHLAAGGGVLEALLASPRVDPNMRNTDGRTALYDAVYGHKKEGMRVLVSNDRVDVNACDPETEDTPLHRLYSPCVDDRERKVFDLLLRRKDINKNVTNDDGESVLMAAAQVCDEYTIRTLLADEEVVVASVDHNGFTALHHVAQVSCDEDRNYYEDTRVACIDAFRENHRLDSKVNLRNKFGKTALHVLIASFPKCVDEPEVVGAPLEALLRFSDIDVNVQIENAAIDGHNHLDTPLHTAVRQGYTRFVKQLLNMPGIDPSLRNAGKRTPCQLACKRACEGTLWARPGYWYDIFKVLLNTSAPNCDLSARNARMLRYVANKALQTRDTSVLRLMLETPRPGIDSRAKSRRARGSKSKRRETVLEHALRKNPSCPRDIRKEVVSIFREAKRKGI